MAKDIYTKRQWHTSNVFWYSTSAINTYLNDTYYNLIDSNVRSFIKQVEIPCGFSGGTQNTPAKVFLLSSHELNINTSLLAYRQGNTLSYFEGTSQTSADDKRIAYYNNVADTWWLRSYRSKDNSYNALYIYTNGNVSNDACSATRGVRPAFILSKDLIVSDGGTIAA